MSRKKSFRIPRGKLAFLYEVTQPFSDEDCDIKIKDNYIEFASMTNIMAFEYKIYEKKEKSLESFNESYETDEHYFRCDIGELNTCLSPFSKKAGSEPIKKSEEIVFFDVSDDSCKFREESREFTGEELCIEKFSNTLWHPLPPLEEHDKIIGDNFKTTVNRISATGESKIKLLNVGKKIFLKSNAGREKLGKLEEKENFSFYLPRVTLKKSCSIVSELKKFQIGVGHDRILLVGEDKKGYLKILLNDVKEVKNNEN